MAEVARPLAGRPRHPQLPRRLRLPPTGQQQVRRHDLFATDLGFSVPSSSPSSFQRFESAGGLGTSKGRERTTTSKHGMDASACGCTGGGDGHVAVSSPWAKPQASGQSTSNSSSSSIARGKRRMARAPAGQELRASIECACDSKTAIA
jgi:hypothetical protein